MLVSKCGVRPTNAAALAQFTDAEQFEGIVIRSDREGRLTYLRDVATVDLGAQSYDSFASRSGMEAANLLVYQLPGSNAMDVAQRVRDAMEKESKKFPPGMEHSIPFDHSPRSLRRAIRASTKRNASSRPRR